MKTTQADVLRWAESIARDAHRGQFRRDGATPYVTHPETVAARVSDAAKPVAWLHDVFEDCPNYDPDALRKFGMTENIIRAVQLLTKRSGQDYTQYIRALRQNPIAREVKIADIEHNLESQPKTESIAKYKNALAILKS